MVVLKVSLPKFLLLIHLSNRRAWMGLLTNMPTTILPSNGRGLIHQTLREMPWKCTWSSM